MTRQSTKHSSQRQFRERVGATAAAAAIRRYREGDEQQIGVLFQEVFGSGMSAEQWRWKYLDYSGQHPLNRVAFDQQGEIIGHAGAIRLSGVLDNRPLPVFQICDVMIHPRARGHLGSRNLFTLLARQLLEEISQQGEPVFAFGFPGLRPFLLGERAGVYERIEQARLLTWRPEPAATGWLRAVPVEWDLPALDRIWNRWPKQGVLSLVRDRAYLEWRYARNPFRRYTLLGLWFAGRLMGWAVASLDGASCNLTELLVPRRRLRPALAALDRWMAPQGIETANIWLPDGWRQELDIAAVETPVVTTNMVWGLPLDTTLVRGCLFYTMGDADIF